MHDLLHPSARGVGGDKGIGQKQIFVTEANKRSFLLCFPTTVLDVSAKLNSKQWLSPLIEIGVSCPLFFLLLAAYSLSSLCRWLLI